MKKVLPINQNPLIKTYTHHGFMHSIISNSEKVAGEKDPVAMISVKDYKDEEWVKYSQRLVCSQLDDDKFCFYADKWNQLMNSVWLREIKNNDYLEVIIDKQLYSHIYSSIKIFVTTLDNNEFESCVDNYDDFLYGTRLGYYPKEGIYYSKSNLDHEVLQYEPVLPITFSIKKTEKEFVFNSIDGQGVKNERRINSDVFSDNKCRLGIAVNLGNNKYYEWLFSNYINTYYSPSSGIRYDFLLNKHKNWTIHTTDWFFDYLIENQRDIEKSGISMLDYIKKQIDLNRYIETDVNDNMNFGIPDYRVQAESNNKMYDSENYGVAHFEGPFFHPDLIYGYDDEGKCLNVMYYSFGKPKLTKLSYELFESDRNILGKRVLFVMNYNPSFEKFSISLKHLLQLFKEYRDGENVSFYEYQYELIPTYFGLDCIKAFSMEENINQVLTDVRLTHILLEQNEVHLLRFEFLHEEMKCFSNESYNQIKTNLLNQKLLITKLRNLCLKNNCGGKIELEKVREYLTELFNITADFTVTVISCLENEIDLRKSVYEKK